MNKDSPNHNKMKIMTMSRHLNRCTERGNFANSNSSIKTI